MSKFDNTIPFGEAILLAKEIAAGNLTVKNCKEACWILGCTIETLDNEEAVFTSIPPTQENLVAVANDICELESTAFGADDLNNITPDQVLMIIQMVQMIISLFRKK